MVHSTALLWIMSLIAHVHLRDVYLMSVFMHLADGFIQSDLQCIQAIYLFSMCVHWELNPTTFMLLTQ